VACRAQRIYYTTGFLFLQVGLLEKEVKLQEANLTRLEAADASSRSAPSTRSNTGGGFTADHAEETPPGSRLPNGCRCASKPAANTSSVRLLRVE